ncbi:transglycosylase SLT domain-containing protein [Alicyclobacillus sendaiensis]|uniref:transglycosylase SLT domain-containing protein n=1 Tax=Alicyclobacillus sendaiensis TaxID=192387 RepID=UPI0026F477B5|nr:transglycosylase SLT domain-containing protein [Alicyclobacillus sendaiensis]
MESIYRIRTSADMAGLREVEAALSRIEAASKRIAESMAKWGGSAQPITMAAASRGGGVAAGGATVGGTSGAGRGGTSPGGATRYDFNSPGGVVQYEEQVLIPAQQMLRGVVQQSASNSTVQIRTSRRPSAFRQSLLEQLGYRIRTSQQIIGATPEQQRQWFDAFGRRLREPGIPAEVRKAYGEAIQASQDSSEILSPSMRDFIRTYGAQFGAPQSQTVTQTLLEAPSTSAQVGRWAGQMLNRLPMLSAVGGIMWGARQFTQGYQLWQQTSGPFDQIAHSLSLTATSVEKFREQVSAAGAQFGWSLQQTAQAASLLTQSFGNLNSQGLANLTSGVASFGLMNGLSSQQATQIVGASATMGITAGVGSVMNPKQFENMITNMAQIGGMQGRQGQMATGLLSLYSNVLQTTPIVPNPTLLAGMYTQLSRTGIRAFQGTSGAQVLESLNQSVANGPMQAIALAAMERTLGKNASKYSIFDLMEAANGGLSAYVPGTHTTIGASLMKYLHSLNPDVAASILSSGTNLSYRYAQHLLAIRNFGTYAAPITTPHTGQRGGRPWMSPYDQHQAALAHKQLQQSDLGMLVGRVSTFWNHLGVSGEAAVITGGMLAANRLLPRIIAGGGGGSLIRGAGAAIRTIGGAGIRAGSSLLRGIGRIGGRALGSIGRLLGGAGIEEGVGAAAEVAGDALDMTGIGAIAGIPLDIIGAALMGGGAGFALSHLFGGHKSSSKPSAAHAVASRTASWQISNLLIDKLQINQLDITGSINSKGGSLSAITKTGSTNQNPFGLMSYDPMAGNPNFNLNDIPGGSNYTSGGGSTSGGSGSSNTVVKAVGGVNNYLKLINQYANKYHVPASVLAGIMYVESRGNPYSIMDDTTGKSYSFSSYSQYLQTAKALLARGDNIDEGLMQINSTHGISPAQAANPSFALNWAANYLHEVYKSTGSWADAIEAYNAGPGGIGSPAAQSYLQKVQAAENSLQLAPKPGGNNQVELGQKTISQLAYHFKSAMRSGTGLSPHTGPVNAYV